VIHPKAEKEQIRPRQATPSRVTMAFVEMTEATGSRNVYAFHDLDHGDQSDLISEMPHHPHHTAITSSLDRLVFVTCS
jgi:hypothetical protein